ncbi:MAG: hypothetical protein ACKPB4_22845 [Sphaerospermopsis kisseleviana]
MAVRIRWLIGECLWPYYFENKKKIKTHYSPCFASSLSYIPSSPEMVIGACIQGIGDETRHPPPPERAFDINHSGEGWGLNCWYDAMKHNRTLWDNGMFPLYDGADFRRRCGSRIRRTRADAPSARHNAYHFHNWLADVPSIRHKYGGGEGDNASSSRRRVKDLNADTALMYQCARGRTERLANQRHGYRLASSEPHEATTTGGLFTTPVYFHDAGYVKKRHDRLRYMIFWDETQAPA